jgi:chemotaxis protein methyltransferase CheR
MALPMQQQYHAVPDYHRAHSGSVPTSVAAATRCGTSFFRDGAPFDALRTDLIPAAVERNADRRTLSIWSAASSSGEELYSIAMVLEAHFPELADWNVTLYGSDVSPEALKSARAGRFEPNVVDGRVPTDLLDLYFDSEPDGYVIAERLRRRCFFEEMNLTDSWHALPVFDIVFCRNVIGGLDPLTRLDVLAKVQRRLAHGGHLVVGAGEGSYASLAGFTEQYVGQTVVFRNDRVDVREGRPAPH